MTNMTTEVHWIGDGKSGIPVRGKHKAMRYEAVRLHNFNAWSGEEVELVCAVGDFVHLVNSEDPDLPFIARIADLWEDKRTGNKMLMAEWCYRVQDLSKGCKIDRKTVVKDEIFLSDHHDSNQVESILETIRIAVCMKQLGATKGKTILTPLIMDDVDPRYGWGDELLSNDDNHDEAEAEHGSKRQVNYYCSRRLDLVKNRVVELTQTDFDKIKTPKYSKKTKSAVKAFTPAAILTLLRLHQFADVVLTASQREESDNVPFVECTQLSGTCSLHQFANVVVTASQQEESDNVPCAEPTQLPRTCSLHQFADVVLTASQQEESDNVPCFELTRLSQTCSPNPQPDEKRCRMSSNGMQSTSSSSAMYNAPEPPLIDSSTLSFDHELPIFEDGESLEPRDYVESTNLAGGCMVQ